jgi:hypothetical protein
LISFRVNVSLADWSGTIMPDDTKTPVRPEEHGKRASNCC